MTWNDEGYDQYLRHKNKELGCVRMLVDGTYRAETTGGLNLVLPTKQEARAFVMGAVSAIHFYSRESGKLTIAVPKDKQSQT